MRNVSLVDRKFVSCSFLENCTAAAVEQNFLYFTSQYDLCKLDLDQPDAENNVEVLSPLDVQCVLDLKYLPEEDALVIVAKSGSVSVYAINSAELEVVGDVSGGISACCWSPDMETLIIISGTGNILLMSRTWDVLQETSLFQQDFGEAKFISVGWGSKETQFHGSEGKQGRTKKEIESKLADWDDKNTRVVWRADGQFFAVNAVDPDLGSRSIRVFSREGHLQSTSEPVSQLEQSLSWKSSGASGLITSTVSLLPQSKLQVAFFEKNGLRHGEFDISSGHQVLESYWNGDSTILALFIRFDHETYGLQLWTMGNYHWYMKHFTPFEKSLRPLWLSWDTIEINRIHLVISNGTYHTIDFGLVVSASKGLKSSDPACVAVVDNCILKMTFFREAVIPPPMCAWDIEFPSSIHSVDMMSSDSNQLFVLTHDGSVHLFQLTKEKENGKECHPKIKIHQREGGNFLSVWSHSASLDALPHLEFYHWRFVNHLTLIASSINELHVFQLEENTFTLKGSKKIPDSRIGAVETLREDTDSALIHLINGKTLFFNTVDFTLSESIKFPEFCARIEVVNDRIIGLAASGRLYVDGKEILSAISSFVIHSDFLVMTTSQKHRLLCLSLARLASSDFAIAERAVERGSKLVHAVATGTTVVLQMPRGNLEAIHPRALSLNIVKSYIDTHSYWDAFNLMKKQRINLNLLFDHNPTSFLEHCPQFVEQIGSVDATNLNLFLGELQNEDYTTTMYQSYYEGKTTPQDDEKVTLVCTRLRQVMDEMDGLKYLLPILTSYIKQEKTDEALKRVQRLADESLKDKALKYMAVLVDGDKLYKEALLTYDLQLTLMVAHRSQKDPKEYLAFLNDLNAKTDENDRRYTIDNFLKRYDSAVRHLCRCQPIKKEEIVSYMKLHRTYAAVVDELCSQSSVEDVKETLHAAACLQAEALTARENHEEVGYLYQRVEMYDRAIDSFLLSGLWTACLSLASRIQMGEDDMKALVTKLIARLRASKKHIDAAHLAEYHLKDYELSGQCLIDGLYFSEAWSLSHRHNLSEWADGTLKKELALAFEAMETKLDHIENECSRYSQRLAIVRQELLHKRDNPPAETDHGDLYSETGSSIFTHTTGTSGRTYRSSKNRRKHERKKLRLKEGSPFEDMAIIHELHTLFSSLPSVLRDVGKLTRGDSLISKDWKRAKLLQSRADSVVKFMENKKKEIWNFASIKKSQEPDKNYGPSSTTEMIISQIAEEKEQFFSTRYLELDLKTRNMPDSLDATWKLESLK